MCGIVGSFTIKSDVSDYSIRSALSCMKNRGPNDQGFERINISQNNELVMGHTRLSIIDLSNAGHQPMISRDKKLTLIFNGEIYNYKELRKELIESGYIFTTQTDTEVLLVAWQHWGEHCLSKLIGMFAFVIFDAKLNKLICVRDGFGIKPFLFSKDEDQFVFASDINALLALRKKTKRLSPQRTYDYLVHGAYDNDERTFLENIYHLMPGHILEFDLKTSSISRKAKWWTPSIENNSELTFNQAAEYLREIFLDSIRLHLRSDVPLGSALSGGIDSSAVVCAMRYLEPKEDIHTFSYIAKNSSVSEESWIDFINESVGAKSYKVIADGAELLDDLDDLIQAQGEPFGSTSIYAQYRVFKLARQNGITVTLDGQGADELLAGYNGYPMPRMQSLFEKHNYKDLISFTNHWKNWPGRGSKNAYKYLGAAVTPYKFRSLLRGAFVTPPKPKWLTKDFYANQDVSFLPTLQPQDPKNYGRRLIESLAYAIQVDGLPQLLRHGDRNSMRFSVESRVPFLTVPISEFLLSLPESYLISQTGETKSIFRAAMRGIVPDKILTRKDKIGFETPEKNWLASMESTIRRWLLDSHEINFLDQKELLKEFDLIFSGKKNFSWQVWRWINFIRWYKRTFN